MTDRISKEQRSRNMSAVRSRGNSTTELALMKILRKGKITGWRRHEKVVGVRPDFIFLKERTAIFVHGCFWHGCRWHGQIPKSNREFWSEKIKKNKIRDKTINIRLRRAGWRVISLWEHEVAGDPLLVIKKLNMP